ncbi:MAG: helix-turn-helix domain-containing protein [Leptospira sp.]|nr:helix-turn-helix domain-containing protein [Leptospira sp.]
MEKTIYTKQYKFLQEYLKKARKKSKLTQVEVSKKIGKPQSFLSKIESGDRRIDLVEFSELAEIYKKIPVEFYFRFLKEAADGSLQKKLALKAASKLRKK